jgi:hypothetical protein
VASVSGRLASARRRAFVGREAELELFASALEAPEPPFVVLHLHGPGGIGKSTLLELFAARAEELGHRVARVDGRGVESSPDGFRRALAAAAGDEAPRALLVDTYEALAPIDAWMREELVPSLPAGTLVVLAGRDPPAPGWREDAGWRELARSVALRNLSPGHARAFLERRGVAAERIEEALDFTHGHPLALALVADVLAQGGPGGGLDAGRSLDVVRVLVQRFTEAVPSALHREALEVCAHARATTEPLLAHALPGTDAHELFEWLRGLSFVERGPAGLLPHELARDALDADLRWRNPEAYAALHRRVRAHVVARLATARGADAQRAFYDLLFLHRNHPAARPLYRWSALGRGAVEPAAPDDHPRILALAARHLGEEEAGRVARWLASQPGAAFAYREGIERFSAFALHLDLHRASDEDLAADPVARRAWEHARGRAPLRAGEEADLNRAWADADRGVLAPSRATELTALVGTRAWMTRPKLAWSFIAAVDPEVWSPMMEHLTFERVPGSAMRAGRHEVALFAHDWRVMPVSTWLAVMGERELGLGGGDPAPRPDEAEPLVVLSQPDFEEAVRHALKELTRPEALQRSVLLRSRVVRERAGSGPRVAALQALLREAVAALAAHPRDEKLQRALHRTYLDPAPTQERAAELLRLPFGTYRRHLLAGVERVAASLWERELFGAPAARPDGS